MSADVLRRRLANALEVVNSGKPDEWIPTVSETGLKKTPHSRNQIAAFTVNALNYHRDILAYDSLNPQQKLLNDIRGLTGNEIWFISDVFHQVQARNDLYVSLSCSDQVAIAAYEAKIIGDHGFLGKAAVGFLRLID